MPRDTLPDENTFFTSKAALPTEAERRRLRRTASTYSSTAFPPDIATPSRPLAPLPSPLATPAPNSHRHRARPLATCAIVSPLPRRLVAAQSSGHPQRPPRYPTPSLRNTMPFLSDRQALLDELEKLIFISLLDDNDNAVDDFSELFQLVTTSRFLKNRTVLFRDPDPIFARLMRMAKPEFHQLNRVSRAGFNALLARISGHPILQNNSRWPQTTPGCVGKMIQLFGIGAGSVVLFTKRMVQALTECRGEWVVWPDVARRKEISGVMSEKGFPGCVGIVDGTTIPSPQKPAIDGEVYFDRKKE
ncbi:hypothetical protein BDK51DRAFT_51473 [Blyttiomyces helicus]|uniref:Uncharacterized protein n=1 Tax=Blyttiomyces helicus TaxID=388810 RepID=A0A4P9WHR1_9FUNG|nr:hypothetical protein BDK51DRAFT_51473 [Blyttiomyces helicus]|eukprot:RKO91932.1 hypothetical protein BDK51DRAFT_51473 [Blyttiomyces helicus]